VTDRPSFAQRRRHPGHLSLFFRHPDDNLIEVAVDLPVMPTEDG
jgi:hypothetical protein